MGTILLIYLLVGALSTLILVRAEEGETYKDIIVNVIISVVLWPLVFALTVLDMMKEDEDAERH